VKLVKQKRRGENSTQEQIVDISFDESITFLLKLFIFGFQKTQLMPPLNYSITAQKIQ
jgi:hypothetical protein